MLCLGSSSLNTTKHTISLLFVAILFIAVASGRLSAPSYKEYLKQRQALIAANSAYAFDANTYLSPIEESANQKFLDLLASDLASVKVNNSADGSYIFAENFWLAKEAIQAQSKLLPVISRIPKGGILHLHLDTFANAEMVIKNLTYNDFCYIYNENNGDDDTTLYGTMKFFDPDRVHVPQGFVQISSLRRAAPDVEAFDQSLVELITMGKHNIKPDEPVTEQKVWKVFEECITRIDPLVYYIQGYRHYLLNGFLDLIKNDNVRYVEFREPLMPLYDIDGTVYPIEEKMRVFIEVVQTIRSMGYPEFNAKWIPIAVKFQDRMTVEKLLDTAMDLAVKFPGWVVGFDLVGEEDALNPIVHYADILLRMQNSSTALPLYLHAGESHLFTNRDMFDALLLGTKRVGHGFNAARQPAIMNLLRTKDIPLEVCPLSNLILGLLDDIRNHPVSIFMNAGLPLTINSDDPGIFGYDFVSYDYLALSYSFGVDLRGMKQLALNSIKYSAMSEREKLDYEFAWKQQWSQFIDWLNSQ